MERNLFSHLTAIRFIDRNVGNFCILVTHFECGVCICRIAFPQRWRTDSFKILKSSMDVSYTSYMEVEILQMLWINITVIVLRPSGNAGDTGGVRYFITSAPCPTGYSGWLLLQQNTGNILNALEFFWLTFCSVV